MTLTREQILDLLATFTLPGAAYKGLRLFLGRRSDAGNEPGLRDPDSAEAFLHALGPLFDHWFRATIRGGEHIPATGPALIIGNHSGGILPFEVPLVFREVMRRHGKEREIYGLAHNFAFDDPTVAKYVLRIGLMRAGHGPARKAFKRGALALVYPGSDYDSFRPWTERNKVCLAGRTGFIRLVLEERVPLVLVATVGAQEAFVVLTRGERLANLLNLKQRVRSNVFPLGFSLPWGFNSSILPYIPLPTRITSVVLPPVTFPRYGHQAATDPQYVLQCYGQVERALQSALDGLAAGRGLPIIG
jgi:1-acyl-sn-glycerol-3-phosphate acyltransferase